ncbi:MAG: DEAD/DEAH box helicase [Acidobacteria bacterium]|nr:DEAD/DEAH box helicase [Acidobacteriota bacterium]
MRPDDLELTPGQLEAADLRSGPLVITGAAGTGRTTALAARFASLCTDSELAPEQVVALCRSEADADAMRLLVEERLERGFSELPVMTVRSFALRLLREELPEGGADPFIAIAAGADRLAMLLERVGELSVRHHDFSGNAAGMLSAIITRIDRLKAEMVTADRFARWAAGLPAGDDEAGREREFAEIFATHDRMLAEEGAMDEGELVLRAIELLGRPSARERIAARHRQLLVDDAQDLSRAALRFALALGSAHGGVAFAACEDEAISPLALPGAGNLAAIEAELPGARRVVLDRSLRCPERVLAAAGAVVAPIEGPRPPAPEAPEGGSVEGWDCENERAQGQAVAAEVERLVREGTPPERIGILVGELRQDGRAIDTALAERDIPHRIAGSDDLFDRVEVRDVLAWLRLLSDPGDSSAVVRALARPPVELRAADLARCVQIARRRKLDMVSALEAATESPQLPPEARERILSFLRLQGQAAAAIDTSRPELFVHRLIDRLGVRSQHLFAAQADIVDRLIALAQLEELAARFSRRSPQATARDFARYLVAAAEAGLREGDGTGERGRPGAVEVLEMAAAGGREFDHVFVLGMQASKMPGSAPSGPAPVPAELVEGTPAPAAGQAAHSDAMRRLAYLAITRARERVVLCWVRRGRRGALQPASPLAEEALAAAGAEWEERREELFGTDETLHGAFAELRDELMGDLPRVAGTIGELRLDNDLDVTLGIVRYLELVKLAAVIGRPEGQSVDEALAQANAVLLQSATSVQREALEASPLDELVLAAERETEERAAAIARRAEPSLEGFLPRRGEGLVLSASDIETYRACPLRYKFARVYRIPQEPTLNQRFGILFHQVLERYHQSGGSTLEELLDLLDTGWRRAGLGDSDEERQLHAKAREALRLYEARTRDEESEPVWFEKPFQFRLGEHTLRGRVDRVDRLPDGGYELIDYKTGRPRPAEELREDVQLSLYALAAREAWDVESERQSYHYVLDDQKIPLPAAEIDRDWIRETVMEVAGGIAGQGFEPTPSIAACSICDFRIACPAAER